MDRKPLFGYDPGEWTWLELPPYAREAVKQQLDEVAQAWVILRTSPPCAMHRQTGELVDLPEPPPPPRCRRCGEWHG